MASNSILNPAPQPLTISYNPELWNNTTKKVISIPSDPVYVSAGYTNTYTNKNTFNGPFNLPYPIIYKNINYVVSSYDLYSFTTKTLNNPLSSIYLFGNTTQDGTLTIPVASQDYDGISITFRRSASSIYRLFSASSNIVNIGTTITYTNMLLDAGKNSCTIVCAKYLSSYYWFLMRTY